jgi:hypothetical protein
MTYTFVTDDANPHLGGNINEGDPFTYSPTTWRYLVDRFAVRTLLDLGSGLGYSAHFFSKLGPLVVAVDGLKKNVEMSSFPTILHDITHAPLYCAVDLIYCVEVVEHIAEPYVPNLMATFQGAKFVMLSHAVPEQGGYHHVNCKDDKYWVDQFNVAGFNMLPEDSARVRQYSALDSAHHIARSALVFARR